MKATIRVLAGLLLAGAGIAASQMAVAQQVSCNAAVCTTAGVAVQFNITIPGVMRFQVGDNSVGTAPTVNWPTAVTTANMGNSTALNPDSITAPGPGAGAGQVYYQLISNLGGTNVTVQAAATTPNLACTTAATCGATSIPWTEILLGTTGTVSPPAPGGSTLVAYGGSTINTSGFWTYQYANTTVPLQGSYQGTVTYTAMDD